MSFSNKKIAVILFNLGAPSSLDTVEQFLFNLFSDKAIIALPQPFRFFLAKLISKLRVKKSQKIYAALGGKSPLLDITTAQADALAKELSFIGNFKTFVAMRYSYPFAQDVVEKIVDYQPDEIILLPLYPQFSSTTSDSSINDFLKRINLECKIKVVCCYPSEQDFIKSHAVLIEQTIAKKYDQNLSDFRFLFSAHGIPKKLVLKGDPYVFHVTKTTEKIIEKLAETLAVDIKKIDFQICYQSKVGPMEWTSPTLEHAIRKAELDKKIPVIIPVSFVSDHSETLVELDMEYKDLAKKIGTKDYLRVPALNLEGNFIKGLLAICKKTLEKSENGVFSAGEGLRICPKNFKMCPNKNPCKP